ncbi:TetR/AcrR family transcriptional regulator [Amycolatopsis sp. H20-H5]|uniref:TetR/AcrR family transcriptional regulator n=1 Tax=Amycolatopsis sp. H20-H5 TaxID=3046309 RepID=UPI002DBD3EF0|nr:TetR family transcriptional regulator [Amycolatopsis sp. H20-H5]MEC3973856.1 TetR family transcriptional regulator [Amycolatopsis sp. H20-H5]
MSALAGHESRSSAGRSMRADARRNREQLVERAKIAFAEFGVDASLDEIARRAGVASGTLYRHFPTRLDLIEAVLAEQIAELVELGRGLLRAEDDFDALSAWLRATLRHGLTYRGLSAAVMSSALDRENGLVSTWHAEMFEVGAALLARARQSGVVVADADEADVLKMVGAIAWAAQDSPDSAGQAGRLLALLMNGLRRGGLSARAPGGRV